MPKIEHSYIYFIVKQKSPVKQSIDRGYKFLSESYIHEIEGKCSSFPVAQLRLAISIVTVSSHFS